jgi:hypothetical protein
VSVGLSGIINTTSAVRVAVWFEAILVPGEMLPALNSATEQTSLKQKIAKSIDIVIIMNQ